MTIYTMTSTAASARADVAAHAGAAARTRMAVATFVAAQVCPLTGDINGNATRVGRSAWSPPV